MLDTRKSKAQLILEVEELRNKVSDLDLTISTLSSTENELAHKTMMLDNILRTATDVAIATTDINLVITYYNPIAEKIFGYKAEEVIGKTVMEIHLQENVSPERLEKAIQIVRKTGEYKYSLEQNTENGVRYLNSRVSSILNVSGEMVGFCLFSRDVTEKVRSDQIIEQSFSLLNNSQALAHIGSWELNLVTQKLIWSDEVFRIFGLEPQSFIPSYDLFLEFIHPDDRKLVDNAYTSSVKEGLDTYEVEHRIVRHKTSELRNVIEQCNHYRDSSGKIIRSVGLVKDITERKITEIKLRESEKMYRLVSENSMHGMYKVNAAGILVFVNNAISDLTGYSQEELNGLEMEKLFPDGEQKKLTDLNIALLQSGKTISGNNMLTCKNGSLVEVHFSCVPLFDKNSGYTGFIGSIIDLTERREAELALLQSRENYRNLVESITDWVWAIDLHGSHIFTNKSVKVLLGFEVEEILGESAFPMIHPDDVKNCRLMVEESIKKKKGWSNIAIRWLHKNGSVHLFYSSSRPTFDANGDVTGFTGIDRDITEQKKAEEALLKSEFDMRTLFNAMTDIVFEMDYEGRYLNIAPTSPDLMFVPVESSIGKTLHEVFPKAEADKFLGFIRACIDKNETLTIEYPLFIEDKTVWFEGKATPKTENSVLYIASDITRRKQLEEQAKHRLIALTQPKVDLGDDLVLTDILDLDLLQDMQDSFADAFNMPSVIYGVDGSNITKPSRFTSFCELLRTTEEGLRRCEEFDRKLMLSLKENHSPQLRTGCALGNMVTGTVPIIIQGRHLANWGIGQMINSELDMDEVQSYASEIGINAGELLSAATELVPVENETFEKAVQFLNTLSNQLSVLALQNLQQARDIDARDKAEKALLNERRLFVSGPTVVFRWIASEGWPVEYVSPNVISVFGITAEEFMSGQVSFASVIHPEDLSRVEGEIKQYTINHIDAYEQEYRIIHPDGTVRWIFDITVITRDEEGNATHYEGYVLDVTNRKDAEVERERLMMAIEQAAEAVVITDVLGSIEYVNPAFERITGYFRDEVIGKNPRVLQSGEHNTTFYIDMWSDLIKGNSWSGKFINRKKDGSLYTEEVSITPIKNSIGEIINYVAVKRDITVEVKLEDQLRQAQKMEAVGQLAGGVAHDFNNLLQVINGYTELALADISHEHSTYEYIQEIDKAGSRAQTLVSQLLSFSRRQIINPIDLDLNKVAEKLMKMIKRVIGEHIKCNFIPGHELGTIHADSGQMEQILMNLCVNSRDAMPDGGSITIETCNTLIDSKYASTHPWAKPGRYVLLSITDDGCGMDRETQKSIFDPFFTTKSIGKGTGLGMSTVYGIVKQHKGDIQVYSELGKGTLFKIYLPVVERKATEIPSKVEASPTGGKETILLAEDDDMVRSLTRQALIMAGYTVIEAANGGEALSLFNKHATQVNLLLLDVVMPELGGKEVYDRIIEKSPSIPTLFCSGYSHNAIHTGFVLDQGLNFIQKPYSPDTLLRTIRKILDL